jgi:hypothetical protein
MPPNPPQFRYVPTDRPLMAEERDFVAWLLRNGQPGATALLLQLADARVVAGCNCGCASVDFGVGGQRPDPDAGMRVVSDFWWRAEDRHVYGVFVFVRGDALAGLEVWSVDGGPSPVGLPEVERLRPIGRPLEP